MHNLLLVCLYIICWLSAKLTQSKKDIKSSRIPQVEAELKAHVPQLVGHSGKYVLRMPRCASGLSCWGPMFKLDSWW